MATGSARPTHHARAELSVPIQCSLIAFAVLAVGGFGALYVLADTTDRTFAWTIRPPVTAAFLGAGYFAGLVGVGYSLWCGQWRQIRLWMMGFFVFSTVTAVATAMHVGPFHFGAGGLAEVAAWAWIAVYIALPIWTLTLIVTVRLPQDPASGNRRRWATPIVVALWAQAAILFAVGVLLFAVPATGEWIWPWELTPLTARAVAAWLLASATLAAVMARERGPAFVGVSAAAYVGQPLLVGVALPRFADQLDWSRPATAVFLAMVAAMVATGLYAVVQSRSAPY